MSPKVAGVANLGKDASSTSRTEVGRGCDVAAGRSDLPHLAVLLGMLFMLLLCSLRSCCDNASPGGVIGRKRLPRLRVNEEVFEVDLHVVLKTLLFPSEFAFSLGEFSIEEPFWDAVI